MEPKEVKTTITIQTTPDRRQYVQDLANRFGQGRVSNLFWYALEQLEKQETPKS